jgi:nucleoside-diphosphate-sugar epimerase
MPCSWVIVRPTSIWGPWFEYSYKTFFRVVDRGWYVQPGKQPIIKPLSFVGNTVHMMQHLLLHPDGQVDGQTYYLGDYPEHSIQEWADLIRNTIGRKGKTPVFPISLLWGLASIGDLLKRMGWSDPPLTKFRLKNMLTGAHYPIEKTQKIVGELPYSLNEGVLKTLDWMHEERLISFKNS